MGAYSGTVTQPSTGRRVDWKLAPGLVGLGAQLDKLGITWYSIGNTDHLKKHGGHTPWKPGAPFGMVTAIDVMKGNYPDVASRILRLMKLAAYDTSWIDFINTNYQQYDYDGRWQAESGDGHLHLEVLGNRTTFTSTLFFDMWGYPPGVAKPPAAPSIPAKPPVSTTTWKWEDDVLKTVKIRSRNEVYLVRGSGELQHLSKDQFTNVKAFNLKQLPSNAATADKTKVQEPFVVENEEALAAFGTKIIAQTSQVEGLA
jgi:hypothetical protein